MPQMSQVLRGHAIGMLTAGMSTRAVARDPPGHLMELSPFVGKLKSMHSLLEVTLDKSV
jgi:hypothetical protein